MDDLDCLITCSMDNTIKSFDLEKAELKESWDYHRKGVLCFAWCPDFKLMASAGEERDM